jgi:hypothetical protein
VNVSVGEKEERIMMTGLHTVSDIFCVGCGSIVGWKYVRFRGINLNFQCIYVSIVAVSYVDFFPQETAHEKTQKYKEGKSVLERSVDLWRKKIPIPIPV